MDGVICRESAAWAGLRGLYPSGPPTLQNVIETRAGRLEPEPCPTSC